MRALTSAVLMELSCCSVSTLYTIDSCHVSIVLVKRFCKFVDLMLTSDNEIVKVIITKAIASAQSPIGMNIAILRNRYDIHVNVNFCHVYKQAMHQPWSTVDVTRDAQFVKELLRVRNSEISHAISL